MQLGIRSSGMLRSVDYSYRRFGTIYRFMNSSSLTAWPLKMGSIRRP
jgi:hypothetical protein